MGQNVAWKKLYCDCGMTQNPYRHPMSEVQYSDIFADIEKQEKIAKILHKILKQRILKTKLLSVENESLSLGTLSQ